MWLAKEYGQPNVDVFLDSITAEQYLELIAFHEILAEKKDG